MLCTESLFFYFCRIHDQMLNLGLTQIYINYCSNRVGTYVGTHLLSKEGQTYSQKKGSNGTGETNDTSKRKLQ